MLLFYIKSLANIVILFLLFILHITIYSLAGQCAFSWSACTLCAGAVLFIIYNFIFVHLCCGERTLMEEASAAVLWFWALCVSSMAEQSVSVYKGMDMCV